MDGYISSRTLGAGHQSRNWDAGGLKNLGLGRGGKEGGIERVFTCGTPRVVFHFS